MAPYRALFVESKLSPRIRPRLARAVEIPAPLVRPRNVAIGVASGFVLGCASLSPLGLMVACCAALGAAVYRVAS